MDTYADDLAKLVEELDLKNAIRVGHSRRHRADQHGFRHTFRAVTADIGGDFTHKGTET